MTGPRSPAALLSLRPARIMRLLTAHPEGLSTPQMVDALAEGIQSRQQALSWYGAILCRFEDAGRLERAGMTAGAGKRGPAVIWRLTSAGHQWLRDTSEKALLPSGQERQEQHRAEREEHALRIAAALERARSLPAASRAQRAEIARELRGMGCSLAQIGSAFGLSREMVRLDLLPLGEYEAILEARRDGRWSAARVKVAEQIARAIERQVCEPGKRCPDRFCPDCIRYQQALKDAAIARQIGGLA